MYIYHYELIRDLAENVLACNMPMGFFCEEDSSCNWVLHDVVQKIDNMKFNNDHNQHLGLWHNFVIISQYQWNDKN